ncbi:hypothetical protein GCM10010232_42510 [Streptomyces amakusaensis]|uniref:Secreted protein n=1 Tax=Streptomyces amakusaensis TaxID=67271 RepID=A0ABW0AG36_9ACTN
MRTLLVAVTASSAIALSASTSTAAPVENTERITAASAADPAVPGTTDPTDPAVPEGETDEVEGGVEGGPVAGGAGEEPDDPTDGPAARNKKKNPSAGLFYSNGDYVHISKTTPRAASGHGWWFKVNGPGEKAKVTVQLQAYDTTAKKWKTVATGHETVKPSKNMRSAPSSHRASARKACKGMKKVQWRSVVDVDIISVNDSPEKATTPARTLECGAF